MVGRAGGRHHDSPMSDLPSRSPPGTARAARRDASAPSPGGAAQADPLHQRPRDRRRGGRTRALLQHRPARDPDRLRDPRLRRRVRRDRLPGLPALRPDATTRTRPRAAASSQIAGVDAARDRRDASSSRRTVFWGPEIAVLAVAGLLIYMLIRAIRDDGAPPLAQARRRWRSVSRWPRSPSAGSRPRPRAPRSAAGSSWPGSSSRAASPWSAARSAAAPAGWPSPRSCWPSRSASVAADRPRPARKLG